MELGSFAFAFHLLAERLPLPASPPACVPPPTLSAEQDLCALLPGTLVALLPEDTISLEPQNLWLWDMVQDHSHRVWLGAEVSLWMPSWSSVGDKSPKHDRRRGPLQGHPQDSLLLSQAVGPQPSTLAPQLG